MFVSARQKYPLWVTTLRAAGFENRRIVMDAVRAAIHSAVMASCVCNHSWICEAHHDRPWPHDTCPGPGELCMNPACPYGKIALANKALDETYDQD